MSNSNLTKYQDELLEILVEECGELIQEKSKIVRFGIKEFSHHQLGKTHLECLTQELGDILAMIQLLAESGMGITEAGLSQAMERKLVKVKQWMTNKPVPQVSDKVKIGPRPAKAKKKGKEKPMPGKNARAMLPLLEEIAERDDVIAAVQATIIEPGTTADAMAKTLELAQTQLDNYKFPKSTTEDK